METSKEEEKAEQTPWSDLSDAQLNDALLRRGLNTDGSREEILQRLQEYSACKEKTGSHTDTQQTETVKGV